MRGKDPTHEPRDPHAEYLGVGGATSWCPQHLIALREAEQSEQKS